MSIAELQKYTAVSKYARYLDHLQRREVWGETVARYEGMLVGKYPEREENIREVCRSIASWEVMPSMRGLQFGGEPVFRHNARLYNCTGSYCDRLPFFGQAFYLLLCGCGVGTSVQERHLSTLPGFSTKRIRGVTLPKKVFRPDDSIEGWGDCAHVLSSSWFAEPVRGFEEYHDCDVEFDLSGIRRKNSKLSFGIGKAPGPVPLRNAIERNRKLLQRTVDLGLTRFRSVDAYDYFMHWADAVVSGGVRRSACIVLFDRWDKRMLEAKTGSWYASNPQRGRSNNSALLLRREVTFEEFHRIFQSTRQFGEPGFYWAEDEDALPNPCFRGSTRLATAEGLVRIDELYQHGSDNNVVVDSRAGKGDVLDLKSVGVSMKPATRVVLTQKNADIYRVETEHGYAVEATANHEFPTTAGRKKLAELKEGDTLLLQSGEGSFGNKGSFEEGYLLGLITGDGFFCGEEAYIDFWEHDFDQLAEVRRMVNLVAEAIPSEGKKPCGNLDWVDQTAANVSKKRIGSKSLYRFVLDTLGIRAPASIKERVPECVWKGSRDFVRGYLQGFFLTDGSVQMDGRGTEATLSLRLNQSNRDILGDVQYLLMNFGVVSRLYLRRGAGGRPLPDGKGGTAMYPCKANYDLVVSRPNILTLLDRIGLSSRQDSEVNRLLDERGRECRKPERYITRITSIAWVATEDVYCLCQPETNTVVANGVVVGQCVEIGFLPRLPLLRDDPSLPELLRDYQGPVVREGDQVMLSGWQMCNLTTINGKLVTSAEDFLARCDAAARLGTWQAGFTDFPYLGRVSERIVEREALLGVSIAGVMHHPGLLLDPEVLRAGAAVVKAANEEEARLIGINAAARATCIKPDGNSAAVLGCFSGGHAGKFRRGMRLVQANRLEAPYQHFRAANPQACEPSAWSANGTDDVIRFCAEYEGLIEDDMSAVEFLRHVRTLYVNWVCAGKTESRCTKWWLSNNVSNTVRVRDDEWDDVAREIYNHRDSYSGVSLLSQTGDRDYAQAPFTSVFLPEERDAMYSPCANSEAAGLVAWAAADFRDLWEASELALGLWGEDRLPTESQDGWLQSFQEYATRHFGGDLRKATYCLKDWFNYDLWCRLKESFVPVDYSTMAEKENGVNLQGEVACAGGACEA